MRFRRRSNSQEAAAWYSVDPRYERLLDRGAVWQSRVITGILLVGWWFAWPAARDTLAYLLLAYVFLDQVVRAGFGGRLLGYRVDQVGLHVVRYGRRDRSYPWETIEAAVESADELLVRTTVGELRIPRDMPAAFHLAQQLRRGGGEWAETGQDLVPGRGGGARRGPGHQPSGVSVRVAARREERLAGVAKQAAESRLRLRIGLRQVY